MFAPEWEKPAAVKAVFTTRNGGVSDSPFASLNFSLTVGDEEEAVRENRLRLAERLPAAPKFLRQAHSARVMRAETVITDADVADAAYTCKAATVCAVTVADCAPVLLCAADGTAVAAVHAGWRGIAAGVLENAVQALRAQTSAPLLAWIGPAIGARNYLVGEEVRAACCRSDADGDCFLLAGDGRGDGSVNGGGNSDGSDDNDGNRSGGGKKYYADIAKLAELRLTVSGAEKITATNECTYADRRNYFSARRDGTKTGRMTAAIWRE